MTRNQLVRQSGLLVLIAGAVFTASGSLGQGAEKKVSEIKDNVGNMWVRGFSGMQIKRMPEGKMRFTVRADAGKKIIATWTKERLKIESGGLEGLVAMDASKAYRLQTATMLNGILVDVTRPSSDPESKAEQTAHIEAAEAEFVAATNTVTVKGGVSFVRKDPGVDQTMTATGSSGVITLSDTAAKSNALSAATLTGPVDMHLSGTRKVEGGKSAKFDIKGHANKMVYNDAARTIIFTGDVKITGDDPSFGGEISGVKSATITLTASGEVDSIDMDGDPGRTIVQERKKSGGKAR